MLTLGSLFTGYGGLDMAAASVFGTRLAWVSDIKPAACKLLAHRHPDVPNLGDITQVDWSAVEPVDVLTGGFPCTDISLAGRQEGLVRSGENKTRSGLWAEMHRAIDILRPRWVVAENVRAIVSAKADSNVEPCPWCVGDGSSPDLRALGAVLADLADVGYDAAWCGLRASDVGAPHQRYRIFILAWPAADTGGQERTRRTGLREGGTGAERGGRSGHPGHATPDAEGFGWHQGRAESAGVVRGFDHVVGGASAVPDTDGQRLRIEQVTQPGRCGAAVAARGREVAADSVGGGRDGRARDEVGRTIVGKAPAGDRTGGGGSVWGDYTPAIRRWEAVNGPAPAPAVPAPKGGQRLSPKLPEWMMGLPAGWITGVPGLSRADMLSLAGDGVVPQQAEAALRWLLTHVSSSHLGDVGERVDQVVTPADRVSAQAEADGLPDRRDQLLGAVHLGSPLVVGGPISPQESAGTKTPAGLHSEGVIRMTLDLTAHLHRQRTFALEAFGPEPRTAGTLAHIRGELDEIAANPTDITEWIDVVILAFDGALRLFTPEQITAALVAKQARNEQRTWPDWRTVPTDQPIEHIKEGS